VKRNSIAGTISCRSSGPLEKSRSWGESPLVWREKGTNVSKGNRKKKGSVLGEPMNGEERGQNRQRGGKESLGRKGPFRSRGRAARLICHEGRLRGGGAYPVRLQSSGISSPSVLRSQGVLIDTYRLKNRPEGGMVGAYGGRKEPIY